MRVILFDVLMESHLSGSLARAFERAGHQVVTTGPVWVGHRFPEGEDLAGVERRLDEALADGADLLFCFRPSTLPPDLVHRAKASGAHTLTWFSDDPVLYQHITRHLVDPYDTILHCGGPRVLAFYEAAFARPTGVNMPFWADPEEFPFLHDPDRADLDVAFLGSTRGDVRHHRYRVLAGMQASVRIFGRVQDDPEAIYGGFLDGPEETALALRRAKLALSIPQRFSEYSGSRYDYPELRSLGSFDMPSRIAQYGAMGLPVVSLDDDCPIGFPEVTVVRHLDELDESVNRLLDEDLVDLGHRVYRRSRTRFCADARVALLEHLVEDPTGWQRLDVGERARYFCEFDRDRLDGPTPFPLPAASIAPEISSLPSVDEQRSALAAAEIRSPHPWRVLFIGSFEAGPTDVVACALRGLRNLGHRVLHLDPERHDGLVRRAARPGGFGPNWVDVDWLEPVLERFDPQIVILAAGGLCLTDPEARRLADRGVLLVGLPLSDSGVVTSMVDHIGHLDLYATSARDALRRNEQAGHTDTTLFPFGVDRAFAAATLTEAPELEADVVCIGGARGRPERRRVMNRLADRFDTRVYGGGWDLPRSEIVEGRRLIQAARAGRIHVNFARTRGGYTNVESGVFESIAAGGVLCTARFDEMAEFFTYGTEIVGWDHVEDLEVKIAGLLGDPERLELYRRRSFARLASEHLYEHRWLDLFGPVLAQLEGGDGPLPDGRFDQLRGRLAAAEEPCRPVLLTGFYGANNLGDDLILESISHTVRKAEPSVEFHIGSTRPATVEAQQALQAHDRRDIGLMDVVVGDAAGVIVGGGGLWHDYTFEASGGLAGLFGTDTRSVTGTARSLILAVLHRVPAHVYSMGVGPLRVPEAQNFLGWLAPQLSSLSVRDEGSAELLKSISGWQQPVEVIPDPVYALPLDGAEAARRSRPEGRRRLGINLRPWDRADPEARRSAVVAALSDLLAEHPTVDLVGIPLQRGADDTEIEQVFGQLDSSRVELTFGLTPDEVVRTIAQCDGVLAMRLHACLLAHRLDVPVVGVGYDSKIFHHFQQVDAGDVVPVDSGSDRLLETLTVLLDDPVGVDRGRIADLERRATDGLVELAGRLAAGPRPAMFGVPPALPPEPRKEDRSEISIDLSQARLVTPQEGGDRSIAELSVRPERIQLSYRVGAPRLGQVIGVKIPVEVEAGESSVLSLSITSPYVRHRNRKWISYQVLLDGHLLVEEDIALWGKPNIVWAEFVPERESVDLLVQLVPRRDCPDWKWQRPSRLVVEAVTVEPAPVADGLLVGASSPHTRLGVTPMAEPARVAPPTGVARVRRGIGRRFRQARRSATELRCWP